MGDGKEVDEADNNQFSSSRKGGYRAASYIFVMSALENVGFVANMVSLVPYLMLVMHFDLSKAPTTVTNFMGTTFLLTILAGFISDTYINRLNTILLFGIFEIAGLIIMTLQAHNPKLHPPEPQFCTSIKECMLYGGNARIFYLSLYLLALGYGGVRGSLPALGADQFDMRDPKERKQQASFFNWYLLSITFGACFGVTVIVLINTNKSWALGFFVSTVLAILGFVFLTLGKPLYRVRVPGESPLVRVIQVIVVALRNVRLAVPTNSDELYEVKDGNEEKGGCAEDRIAHTTQFRMLDKAAVLPQGSSTPKAWKVCPVTQVEQVKILVRMLPILFSTIVMNTCLAQLQTYSVTQGTLMDRHLDKKHEIPAESVPVIPLAFMSLLIPLYEFAFVPFARRITGHPSGITHLQRVGVGLVLSVVSMSISAAVEVKRKNALMEAEGPRQISVFWLSFQFGVFGVADMFTLVGLLEFFYSEAPAGMRSLSMSFTYLSLSLGFFLSSVLVHTINSITRRKDPNKLGWIEGLNLNAVHLDRFYWFLAVLSGINFVNYLFWAHWYRYKKDREEDREEEEEDSKEEQANAVKASGEGGDQ